MRAWKVIVGGMALALLAGCAAPDLRVAKMARYRPNVDDLFRPVDSTAGVASGPKAISAALPPAAPEVLRAATGESDLTRVLQVGDRIAITIRVPSQPPEAMVQVVDQEGCLNFQFIGNVKVSGLSASEAQKKIEKTYIDQKYYNPNGITVVLIPPENEFAILGEVLKPGSYPMTKDLNLSLALAKAGRFTDFANQKEIKLMRGRQTTVYNYKKILERNEPDPMIKPGDVIIVERTWLPD